MDNPQTLCARCAGEGRTCCQGTAIFLTGGDVERIGAVCSDDFWEMRKIDSSEYEGFLQYDAVWGRIFAKGEVRIIRHRDGGDCMFLGVDGCVLELGERPLVCRLYPYDYNETTLKGVHGHLCPLPEGGNGALLLALLGMNREEGEGWRGLLYEEISREYVEF